VPPFLRFFCPLLIAAPFPKERRTLIFRVWKARFFFFSFSLPPLLPSSPRRSFLKLCFFFVLPRLATLRSFDVSCTPPRRHPLKNVLLEEFVPEERPRRGRKGTSPPPLSCRKRQPPTTQNLTNGMSFPALLLRIRKREGGSSYSRCFFFPFYKHIEKSPSSSFFLRWRVSVGEPY